MPDLKTNVLYYGDNLDILRHHIPDESIDLIYLDPPFNSNRSYNVLFRESSGAASDAQLEAFEDTWHWGRGAAEAYEQVVTGRHQNVASMLKAMVEGLGHNDVTAYLTMMAIRLLELRRVLKDNGSMYLHCDPTAGPYLRVLVDSIFAPRNLRNEIVWKRSDSHNAAQRYGPVHDTLLFYTKGDSWTWNQDYAPLPAGTVARWYRNVEPETGRRYNKADLTGEGLRAGTRLDYLWKGKAPPKGRHWAITEDAMAELDRQGLLLYSRTGMPYRKRYLDESKGVPLLDVWTDIDMVRGIKKGERLGYATQKPLPLLERIISASSNPGDIVLDPFCGCGTAVHAAHALGRRWIGIDITHLAIGLIRRRMYDAFPDDFRDTPIEVVGEPVDLEGARELAKRDKYQFQWWALDRLGAQPVSGKKKGSDKGIDGVIPFFAGPTEDYKRAIVSVKGGEKVGVSAIRDLKGVLSREKEPLGILLTLHPATGPMLTEAAAAGFYENEFWKKKFPRVQIVTVEDILGGKRPDIPWGKAPFAKAQREKERSQQDRLL
jgi:site-specific DNA-methyltransferase (adenine-specific)